MKLTIIQNHQPMYKIIQPLTPSLLLRNLGNGSNFVLHNTRDHRRVKLDAVTDVTEHKEQIIMIHDEESHYVTNNTLVSILNPRHAHAPFTFWLRPKRVPIRYHIFPTTKLLPKLFDQSAILHGHNSIDIVDTEGFTSCGQFHAWQTLDFRTYIMDIGDVTVQFAICDVEEPYPAYGTIGNPLYFPPELNHQACLNAETEFDYRQQSRTNYDGAKAPNY